jgi:hypothetical protein
MKQGSSREGAAEEEAERAERRWERRRLWYGLAAGALLVLTPAVALVSPGRR